MAYINWVDIVFVIILLRTAYIGYSKGLLSEIFRTLAMIATFVISTRDIYITIGKFIIEHSLVPHPANLLIAYGAVAMGSLLCFNAIGWIISGVMKIEFIPGLERFIGLMLGMVRGFLFLFILMVAVNVSEVSYMTDSVYKKSFSAQYLIRPFEVATSIADKIWGLFQRQS